MLSLTFIKAPRARTAAGLFTAGQAFQHGADQRLEFGFDGTNRPPSPGMFLDGCFVMVVNARERTEERRRLRLDEGKDRVTPGRVSRMASAQLALA